MKRFTVAVLLIGLVAGCANVSERQKPASAPASTAAPGPTLPAPTPASAGSEQGTETVLGAVTKIDKEMGLLELQTPSGWSQFMISDPERKKELERVTAGEKVEVKVQVQGGERKVMAVLRWNPPGTLPIEPK